MVLGLPPQRSLDHGERPSAPLCPDNIFYPMVLAASWRAQAAVVLGHRKCNFLGHRSADATGDLQMQPRRDHLRPRHFDHSVILEACGDLDLSLLVPMGAEASQAADHGAPSSRAYHYRACDHGDADGIRLTPKKQHLPNRSSAVKCTRRPADKSHS